MDPHALSSQHIPRLLAIDDSPLIHRLLKAKLRAERLEIHSATSGEQGLQVARALSPDLILLDINLPDMDGIAALQQLKSDPATHEIPVIILSGDCNTNLKVKSFDVGAIDYITKPFEMAELRARVRSAMRIRSLITLLAQRAQVDGLTGLWNRHYLDHRLAQAISDARRVSLPLSLIMCDLDHFKKLNDSYGHPMGDQVLEEFARILANNRAGDIPCRYGGEEFVVICPNVAAEDARNVADRIRKMLRDTTWDGCPGVTVTASFGVTDLSRVAEPSAREMIESADRALYQAKHSGRDTTCIAPTLDQLRLTA